MLSKLDKKSVQLEIHLKEIRARFNVTQQKLAQGVGVSRQTILFIESGKYVPSLLLALMIAKYLKVNVNTIFSLKERKG